MMPEKPLPKWRANLRRYLADRGYGPDWDDLDRKRKKVAFMLLLVGAVLGLIALIGLGVIWASGCC